MGPLKQVLSMLPLVEWSFPAEALDVTAQKMSKYRVIMDSMTSVEPDDPTVPTDRGSADRRGAGARF